MNRFLPMSALFAACALTGSFIFKNIQKNSCISSARTSYFADEFNTGLSKAIECRDRFGNAPAIVSWIALNQARAELPFAAKLTAAELRRDYPNEPLTSFAIAGAHIFDESNRVLSIRSIDSALKSEPMNSDFIWMKAELLRLHHRFEDALTAIDKSPVALTEYLLLTQRGTILADMAKAKGYYSDDLKPALQLFLLASRQAPDAPKPLYLAGFFLLDAGEPTKARGFLERAALLSPSPSIHSRYWTSLQQSTDLPLHQKIKRINDDVARSTQRFGLTPSMISASADALADFGELAAAEKKRALLQKLFPKSPEAAQISYIELSRSIEKQRSLGLLSDQRRREAALAYIDLARNPDLVERLLPEQAAISAIKIIREQQRPDKILLSTAGQRLGSITIDPGAKVIAANAVTDADGPPELARGYARSGLSDISQYLNRLGISSQQERDTLTRRLSAQLHHSVGYSFMKSARFEEAINEFGQASQLDRMAPEPYENLGDVLALRLELASAEQEYLKCASLGGPVSERCRIRLVSMTGARGPNRFSTSADDKTLGERLSSMRKSLMIADTPSNRTRPDFLLFNRSGGALKADDLRGKVTVLTFWGAWCSICKVELPVLFKYAQLPRNNEISFILVNDERGKEANEAWLASQRGALPNYNGASVFKSLGVQTVPTTIFLDKKGRVAFRMQGFVPTLDEEFTIRLSQLKAEKL
jgi:tetratricopeptide (TPR) repeat protein/thiol-disulfide isomerase/thioredoxin